MVRVGRLPRSRVYRIARFAFIEEPDQVKAEKLAAQLIEEEYEGIITSIIVGVLIKLAVEFIAQWIREGFSMTNPPPEEYVGT